MGFNSAFKGLNTAFEQHEYVAFSHREEGIKNSTVILPLKIIRNDLYGLRKYWLIKQVQRRMQILTTTRYSNMSFNQIQRFQSMERYAKGNY